jgi:phage regulator Rha-like protein
METNLSLVRLNTQDVSKAIPVTDTAIVAKKIDYPHYAITRLIKNHYEDFNEFGTVDFESQLLNSKRVDVFLLTEGQFLLLVTYLRATKKAPLVLKLKKDMVKSFLLMRNELQARTETRAISKQVRKSLTDTIKDKVSDEGNFKRYAYGNYSKLVYKVVTGMDVKKYKALHGLKEKDNIRDFFSLEEIEKVQELESKIAYYIEMRTDITGNDKETYAEVKKYVDSLKAGNKLLP